MKNCAFFIGLFLFALTLCGCSDDDSEDNGWVNKIEDLYKHNQKKISIKEGVYGTLILREGDCMPKTDGETTCWFYPVTRKIEIYEPTTRDQVEWYMSLSGISLLKVKSKFIGTVASDEEGFFELELPEGKYSVFIKEEDGLYAAFADEDGYINSVTIEAGEIVEKNLLLNFASD